MAQKKLQDPEYEVYKTGGNDDGTFLMCYKDWRTYFTNLFYAIDFPEEFHGRRFIGEWNQSNAGGFPTKSDDKTWAKNPQFLLSLKKTTELFIFLGQNDGRLVKGEKFHFPNCIHPVMIMVQQVTSHEPLKRYDHAKTKANSVPKEYREVSLEVKLSPGDYMIIPW
jgi:Calpain large subunit, domain III.